MFVVLAVGINYGGFWFARALGKVLCKVARWNEVGEVERSCAGTVIAVKAGRGGVPMYLASLLAACLVLLPT